MHFTRYSSYGIKQHRTLTNHTLPHPVIEYPVENVTLRHCLSVDLSVIELLFLHNFRRTLIFFFYTFSHHTRDDDRIIILNNIGLSARLPNKCCICAVPVSRRFVSFYGRYLRFLWLLKDKQLILSHGNRSFLFLRGIPTDKYRGYV